MGKYGLAAILAIAYTATAVFIVQSEGRSHRASLLAKSRGLVEPIPSPTPAIVAPNRSEAVSEPAEKEGPEIQVVAKAPEPKDAMIPDSSRKELDPSLKPNLEKVAKPAAKSESEAFWSSPELSKVWDLKLPTLEDETGLGSSLYRAIVKMKPESDDNALLSRVEDAAEPLLKLRVRKERPVKFVVLEGNEWNAFSHPGDYIYVTSGLLKHISVNDDEIHLLQFVIAHELFHLDNLHALIALNLPDVVGRPGGTAAHYLLLILPYAYPDEAEFAADRWAYQTLVGPLHREPLEAREFLLHFENYAKQPRNNFEAGRAKPKIEPGVLLLDNHFPAHPKPQKRLRLLKDLSWEGQKPRP